MHQLIRSPESASQCSVRRSGGWSRLLVAAILTGIAAGLGGVVLTEVLHGVQHLAFGYTENTFLVGVERASSARRVIALTGGGLLVGMAWWWMRHRHSAALADDLSVRKAARGPARMPIVATILDALIQIVAVAVGGSLGREGAPRQMGAALAGEIAHRMHLDDRRSRMVLAAGAGAGLAAVYNVPLAGAIFTIEVVLASIALDAAVVAVVASIVATTVAWPLLGSAPTYRIPHDGVVSLDLCLVAAVLGVLSGFVGSLVNRLATFAREHAPRGPYAALATTATFATLGIISIGAPDLLGNGKALAQLAFDGLLGGTVALLLALLKPLATALCLGGGAIGGTLTPSFATGATLGWGIASIAGASSSSVQTTLVLATAAAVTATAQRAACTAVVFTLEITGEPLTLVPVVVVAVLCAVLMDRPLGFRRFYRFSSQPSPS